MKEESIVHLFILLIGLISTALSFAGRKTQQILEQSTELKLAELKQRLGEYELKNETLKERQQELITEIHTLTQTVQDLEVTCQVLKAGAERGTRRR